LAVKTAVLLVMTKRGCIFVQLGGGKSREAARFSYTAWKFLTCWLRTWWHGKFLEKCFVNTTSFCHLETVHVPRTPQLISTWQDQPE